MKLHSHQLSQSLGKNLGFTLLELMVVITIISTMAIMVLPNMKFSNNKGQSTLLSLQKPIEKWRLKALETGQSYIIRVDGSQKQIRIVQAQDAELLETSNEENLLDKLNVDQPFYITALNDKNVRRMDIEIRATGSTIPFEIFTEKGLDRLVYSGLMTPGRIEKWIGDHS